MINMVNLINYSLIAVFSIILFLVFKPFINKYLYRLRLESEFLDFLSILLTLEATGLRLDNVLEEALNNKLILPSSFMNIAKKYGIISRLNPDPYNCIRVLSREIPSNRVSSFFRGYSEVLISSNDTLHYVESFLKEELKSIESRIENYISILDTVYESFLIIILGFIIYSIMPIIHIDPIFFSIVLSILSTTALLIVCKLNSLAMFHYNGFTYYTLISLVALCPLITSMFNIILFFHLSVVFLGIMLLFLTNSFLSIENNILLMLEDLYSSVRQGFSIDSSIVRISCKYGFPVELISNLIKIGFKAKNIISVLKIPVFAQRIFNLILAPIEYSHSFPNYLGYVLNITDSIKSLRRILSERVRVYYMYVFILLSVSIAMLKLMNNTSFVNNNNYLVKSLIYSSIFESCIIASTIGSGYWFRSKIFYILLTICLLTILILV